MKTGNLIVDLSFEFALRIISFCETLEEKKKFVIANQLLKSGASIGANIREAQHCESKADFVHKLKIAAKEAGEAEYWLLLCQNSNNYPFEPALLYEVQSIQKVL
jgi:four helix bundle protein